MPAVATRAASTTSPHPGLGFVEFIALVASLMAINAMSVDVMLAGLPAIGESFGITQDNHRQFVLGAYLIGFAGAQLLWGPLADRYGRTRVLLVGLGLFGLATIAAAMATSFTGLLVARFAQGVTAASTRVIAVALVRDCYTGRELGRVMSLVMMVFMVVPILAPSLGQLVLFVAPWRWIFALLFLASALLLLWCAVRLPETLPDADRRPLAWQPLVGAYSEIVTHRVTMGYTLALGVIFGTLFGFLTSAQQIFQEVYGLGPWFTLAFAVTAIFMSSASFLNATLVRRWGMRRLSHGALLAFIGLGAVHGAVVVDDALPFWAFFVLQTAMLFLFGFIGANFNAMAMEPMGHIAGTAASVIGFTQTLLGAVLGSAIGQAFDGTIVPLVTGYGVLGMIALGIVMIIERGRLMQPLAR